jgi:hypothetical protein
MGRMDILQVLDIWGYFNLLVIGIKGISSRSDYFFLRKFSEWDRQGHE